MTTEKQIAALRTMSGNRGKKPTCAKGHVLPATRNKQGRRKCKQCHAIYSKRWRSKRRKLVRELLILLNGYRMGELSAEGFAGRAAMLQAESESDYEPPIEIAVRTKDGFTGAGWSKVILAEDGQPETAEPPGAVERPTPLDMERESFNRECIERYGGGE